MSINIQGKEFILKLREDGSTGAFSEVVCESTSGFSSSAAVTTETTKCGNRSTIAEPVATLTFEGIYEDKSTIGYVTANEIVDWHNATTKLNFQYSDPLANLYFEGNCYISEFTSSAPSEGFVTFTFTLQVDGSVTTTP